MILFLKIIVVLSKYDKNVFSKMVKTSVLKLIICSWLWVYSFIHVFVFVNDLRGQSHHMSELSS